MRVVLSVAFDDDTRPVHFHAGDDDGARTSNYTGQDDFKCNQARSLHYIM